MIFFKRLTLGIFLLGLFYIILPGPFSINNFPPLPGSEKSDLEGDTIQNPNIAAYFSQFDRSFITDFYRKKFSKMLIPFISIPSIRLNHPPEEAYQYVRDQQESTFLEEYIHPLRESLYINGYEPAIQNDILKSKDRSFVGDHLNYQDQYFNSKATIRYYPSNIFARIMIYFLIWFLMLKVFRLYKKVFV